LILTPAQIQIASDTHRFRVVNCGRRFGKTTLAVEEIKGKAIAKESSICYLANTYQQARDIAWNILKKELRNVAKSVNESRLEIRVHTVDGGESLIVLRGWESVDTLRGQHFDFLVVDEVASMKNFWSNWEEVLRPTLTDTRGEALFISTPKGFNHFYDLFCNEDEDYKAFHFTSYDNPYLPVEELDKAKQEVTEDRFAQEYMADFRKTEGLVYKEFNRDLHIYEEIKGEIVEKIVGLDWGYTNPTAILTIERAYNDVYYVSSEYYKKGKTTEEIIEYCRTLHADRFYPDPAEPDRLEQMQRTGLVVREVNKDVEKGIDSVRHLFKNNRLKIHKSCANLIYELETYVYEEGRDGRNDSESPVKENDHALDALRYALFMQEPVARDYNLERHIYENRNRGNVFK
jgi:PBSX family phage terminase large subunit